MDESFLVVFRYDKLVFCYQHCPMVRTDFLLKNRHKEVPVDFGEMHMASKMQTMARCFHQSKDKGRL